MAQQGVMVQSIERAIQILNCFNGNNSELTLQAIANELNLNKSTVHGILNTLKHYGLVEQDEERGKYRLGMHLLVLSNRLLDRLEIRGVAGSVIQDLAAQVGETVHLVILRGTDVVYIDKCTSNRSFQVFTSIGMSFPAYVTGVGKVLLANKSDAELCELIPSVLRQVTEHSIGSREELLAHLRQVRQQGYAFDKEENEIGLSCVAAPVFDHTGKAMAAISVAGPSARLDEKRMQELVGIVRQAADEISRRLGYRP
ncbi:MULTISPECIES: IclR family transcriptional regulator [Sporomusa]|uniref:IclR family transcriptional regulator n=1 Tax=Sporomusa TaxID=2375 RepID=UPI00166C2D04|nr:IclR family transcriptional regulator [Sporomusa sp. GT1]MCM0759909.1 IclR family transcriptional regulator [Sporomusa sphaeroides DSM 2875]